MNLDHAASLGFDADRLGHLGLTIQRDIDAQRYDGAVLAVTRGFERMSVVARSL